MSLDNLAVVDAVGTDLSDGTVVLNIIDGWDWEDERHHLTALQDKLNLYLGFVETGQIYEAYPDAKGRPLRIEIVGKFSLTPAAEIFLTKASSVAGQLGISVVHRLAGATAG